MANHLRVTAAVSEFLHVWAWQGGATLTLETVDGQCFISFKSQLPGLPSDHFQGSPVAPPPFKTPAYGGQYPQVKKKKCTSRNRTTNATFQHQTGAGSPIIGGAEGGRGRPVSDHNAFSHQIAIAKRAMDHRDRSNESLHNEFEEHSKFKSKTPFNSNYHSESPSETESLPDLE